MIRQVTERKGRTRRCTRKKTPEKEKKSDREEKESSPERAQETYSIQLVLILRHSLQKEREKEVVYGRKNSLEDRYARTKRRGGLEFRQVKTKVKKLEKKTELGI